MQVTDKIQITNEDNMALMSRYDDNYFDLAIVDPPYGININVNMGRRKGDKKSSYHKFHNEENLTDFSSAGHDLHEAVI